MRFLTTIICLFLLAGCASTTGMQDAPTISKAYFAGVSFSGEYKDYEKLYPYSYAVAHKTDAKGNIVDRIFREKLANVNNPNVEFSLQLGDTQTMDAVALSFAINMENVTVSKISGNDYKLVLNIFAEILIFDFSQKKAINSYPVSYQYVSVFNHEPSKREILSIVEGLYLGNNPDVKTNILDLATDQLKTLTIKGKYGNRLKVTDVSFGEDINTMLQKSNNPTDMYKTIIAQSFSKYLTANQGVAVLPYTKGQTIGSKMAARFVNGDIYNLEIPTSDFGIEINVDKFKTAQRKQANTTYHAFFTYCRIKLLQPDLNKVYMDLPLRGAEGTMLFSGQEPDLRASYTETLMNLFDNFSKNVTEIDDDWIAKSIAPDNIKKAKKEFSEFDKIIRKCK